MKYFGTDGIRGVAGKDLSSKFLKKLALGLVRFYKEKNLERVLLVGNDSRISSDFILSNIESVLLEYGIKVHDVGICSSPCLAYLTKKYKYPLSMMISASHNPYEYNGVKFFNANGEKISEKSELMIEHLIEKTSKPRLRQFAVRKYLDNIKTDYIDYLKSLIHFDLPIIIDCACGGASEICKRVFHHQHIVNSKMNGYNINCNSGCTDISFLRSICIKENKVGIAVDGDADRVIIVDKNGDCIDGDEILYILSKFYLRQNDSVVGTIYSNTGLEKSLNKHQISLIRSNVGDKAVYNLMKKHNAILGGEKSGHIIFTRYSNTGDGLLNAIIILNILYLSKRTFAELLSDYTSMEQIYKNISLNGKFSMNENLRILVKKYEHEGARIIIRPSGTEPVLRLMVEHENKTTALEMINHLQSLISIKNREK